MVLVVCRCCSFLSNILRFLTLGSSKTNVLKKCLRDIFLGFYKEVHEHSQ